jgi:hypothetical protein
MDLKTKLNEVMTYKIASTTPETLNNEAENNY